MEEVNWRVEAINLCKERNDRKEQQELNNIFLRNPALTFAFINTARMVTSSLLIVSHRVQVEFDNYHRCNPPTSSLFLEMAVPQLSTVIGING
jgi:hypothetical protein